MLTLEHSHWNTQTLEHTDIDTNAGTYRHWDMRTEEHIDTGTYRCGDTVTGTCRLFSQISRHTEKH